jgi:SAM-dependent methyltransferase
VIENAKISYRSFQRATFEAGRCEDLVERNDCFDIIVSFETLEHLDEPAQVRFLDGIRQRLKPGGIFILSTPNKTAYRHRMPKPNPFHRHELSFGGLQQLIQSRFRHALYAFQNTAFTSRIQSIHPVGGQDVACIVRDDLFNIPSTGQQSEGWPLLIACCSDEPFGREVEARFSSFYWDAARQRQSEQLFVWAERLQREFDERTEWALKLDKEIVEKNTLIGRLQKEVEERTTWALALDREIAEKNAYIRQLQKEFDERTSWALGLDIQLEEARRQLSLLSQQKQELEQVHDYLGQQLRSIGSSRLYRFLALLGLLPTVRGFQIKH